MSMRHGSKKHSNVLASYQIEELRKVLSRLEVARAEAEEESKKDNGGEVSWPYVAGALTAVISSAAISLSCYLPQLKEVA